MRRSDEAGLAIVKVLLQASVEQQLVQVAYLLIDVNVLLLGDQFNQSLMLLILLLNLLEAVVLLLHCIVVLHALELALVEVRIINALSALHEFKRSAQPAADVAHLVPRAKIL